MARREPQRYPIARYVAPAAFLLAVTIAVLLIRAGMAGGDSTVTTAPTVTTTTPAVTTSPAETTGTGAAQPTETGETGEAPAEFYAIQEGDTLDKVALDHDTTVEQLLLLNPGVDINSLQIGQRIRVK